MEFNWEGGVLFVVERVILHRVCLKTKAIESYRKIVTTDIAGNNIFMWEPIGHAFRFSLKMPFRFLLKMPAPCLFKNECYVSGLGVA